MNVFRTMTSDRMASSRKKHSSSHSLLERYVSVLHQGVRIFLIISVFVMGIWSIIQIQSRIALDTHPSRHGLLGAVRGTSYVDAAVEVDDTLLSPLSMQLLLYATDRMGTTNDSVLGTTTEINTSLGRWQQVHELDVRRFNGWKEMIARYPAFGDVYFRAAYYAIRLGMYDDAQKLITRGSVYAPTSEVAPYLMANIPR